MSSISFSYSDFNLDELVLDGPVVLYKPHFLNWIAQRKSVKTSWKPQMTRFYIHNAYFFDGLEWKGSSYRHSIKYYGDKVRDSTRSLTR